MEHVSAKDDLVKQPIVWVEKNEDLEKICEILSDKDLLAVDTEFMRSRTYYPIAGLIQISDGECSYLIDPQSVTDFYPLIDIFDDERICKALHSCSEDLEVFQHTFGCLPNNIIDTQIAGAMAGYGYSQGFATLVNSVVGVELPKSETRSDWLQRPLSRPQIRYAAVDVEYLHILSRLLIDKLKKLGRLQWLREDSCGSVENFFGNQDPNKTYLRFKSAWKLDRIQLSILKNLSRWRENLAQERNVPRNRVLKEATIYSISQQAPQHISQLRNFEGINERMIRSNGNTIIGIVSDSKKLAEEELPNVLPRPLDATERKVLGIMKSEVAGIAESLSVPSELLVRKKDYEQLITSRRNGDLLIPKTLNGWRKSIVGDTLQGLVVQAGEGL